MKSIRTSLQNNKTILLFICVLFVFGLATGILFYIKQDSSIHQAILETLTEIFQNNVFAFKNIIYHFIILILICVTLFCFLGIPLSIIYIFFEGLSLGFTIPIFVSLFKIKAIGYFLAYFLFIKSIYILLLFLFFIKILNFTKIYIQSLKNKNYSFMASLKYMVVLLLIILANDFIVYFISNRILIFLLG